MKKLQNNFTTPELSKRLLELGVPADSADCFLLKCRFGEDTYHPALLHDELYSEKDKFTNLLDYMPCWSVGRLIEIYLLCHAHNYIYEFLAEEKPIDAIVSSIEYALQEQDFDFSKLEE